MKQIDKTKLALEKITKGAVLYKATKHNGMDAITMIYLRKSGLTTPYPSEITLTVEISD